MTDTTGLRATLIAIAAAGCLIAAGFLFAGSANRATGAEACEPPQQTLVEFSQEMVAANLKMEKLSDEDVATLTAVEEPPVEYDSLYVVSSEENNAAIIAVVEHGCVVLKSNVLPLDFLDNILGRTKD